MTPTINEIKEATFKESPYFFDAKTLHGFGQSLEDFTVAKSPKGKIFIYAPSYWGSIIKDSHLRVHAFGPPFDRHTQQYPRLDKSRNGMKLMGYTFREFTGTDLKICDSAKDLDSVLEYIENN